MLNPFGFAQAKLREASRSSNGRVDSSLNEILCRCAPQNDDEWEPSINTYQGTTHRTSATSWHVPSAGA